VGNFSLIDIAERQWHYIAQLIDRIAGSECDEISPRREAMEQFERARASAARDTVWYKGGCDSWYLDKNGIPSSWPWSYSRFLEAMAEPDWEAFECVSRDSGV
jgi:hypothetical protein